MSQKFPLLAVSAILFTILFLTNVNTKTEQHFTLLAQSFLNGKTTIEPIDNNISNLVFFGEKYYWPLGPFPSIILIPLVFIFGNILQGYLSFALTLLSFYLLYLIARKFKLDSKRSLLGAIFFIFGSIFTPQAMLPASWYFAQVVACSFLIFAVYEFLSKRRYFLIGFYLAAATATRLNLAFSSVFFLYFLLQKPNKSRNLLLFLTPLILTFILISFYNYMRFKNPLENGYNLQIVNVETQTRRAKGLFSPVHIPSNLFYMLLSGPIPVLDNSHELKAPYVTFDGYGLSLFFLSPVLFLIFKANYKNEITKVSAITIAVILIPILTYYGIGQRQVGFRYALDFFPFLFLILLEPFKKTSLKILYPLVFWGVCWAIFFSFIYLGGFQIN